MSYCNNGDGMCIEATPLCPGRYELYSIAVVFRRSLSVGVLLLLTLVQVSFAQITYPPRTGCHALLIGVGSFESGSVTRAFGDFAGAERAALEFRDLLIDPDVGRFPVENVQLLYGADATLGGITSALERLVSTVHGAELVIVFFSGHGRYNGVTTDLIPYDAKRTTFGRVAPSIFAEYEELLSTGIIDGYVSALDAKNIVVMIEACESGAPIGYLGGLASSTSTQNRVNGQNRFYLLSSSHQERSFRPLDTDDALGYFSSEVLATLRGEADAEHANDGWIDLEELATTVATNVPIRALLTDNQDQHPVLFHFGTLQLPRLVAVPTQGTLRKSPPLVYPGLGGQDPRLTLASTSATPLADRSMSGAKAEAPSSIIFSKFTKHAATAAVPAHIIADAAMLFAAPPRSVLGDERDRLTLYELVGAGTISARQMMGWLPRSFAETRVDDPRGEPATPVLVIDQRGKAGRYDPISPAVPPDLPRHTLQLANRYLGDPQVGVRNPAEALKWYLIAATTDFDGRAEAAYEAGRLLESGRAGAVDPWRALEVYRAILDRMPKTRGAASLAPAEVACLARYVALSSELNEDIQNDDASALWALAQRALAKEWKAVQEQRGKNPAEVNAFTARLLVELAKELCVVVKRSDGRVPNESTYRIALEELRREPLNAAVEVKKVLETAARESLRAKGEQGRDWAWLELYQCESEPVWLDRAVSMGSVPAMRVMAVAAVTDEAQGALLERMMKAGCSRAAEEVAKRRLEAGDYAGAVEAYFRSAELNPRRATEMYENMAVVYDRWPGRPEAAVIEAKRWHEASKAQP